VRVHELVPEARWRRRFDHINAFEAMLVDEGTTVVKVFLHISKDEQRERLQARLDEPEKHWKFRRADLEVRALWDRYEEAFAEAISRTSTSHAPWHVVPANKKWYRNWAVATIMVSVLDGLELTWPPPEEDLSGIVID
jgi:polyphosphate kinase 2 (PPK2 family)